jgi:hypothetical protein
MNLEKIKNFMLTEVGPVIKNYFEEANPALMEMWQGNCCRQTAIVIANMLNDSLEQSKFKVFAFEGEFEDFFRGRKVQYNHCWVFVKNIADKEKSLFIDVARTHKPNIVMFKKNWEYPKNMLGYLDQKTLSLEKIDYENEVLMDEYFTGIPGIYSYKDICNVLNLNSSILN